MNNSSVYNESRLPGWEFGYIVLCSIYFIVPMAQASFNFLYATAIGLLYPLYLYLSGRLKSEYVYKFILLVAFICLLYTVLNDAGSIGNVSNRGLKRYVSKLHQYVCMFYPLSMLYRTITRASKKQKKIIFIIALVAMILSSQTILQYIQINPLAARNFGREGDEDLGTGFIAPYPFVYGMTLTVVTFFLLIKNSLTNEVRLRFFYSLLFAYFVYFLFKSQYTLALVTTFITIMYVIYKSSRFQSTRILVIIGGIVFVFIMPMILDTLIAISPDMLAQRFGEFKTLFTGEASEDDGSDMMGRFDLYKNCILAFLSSPIYGNRTLPFDGHATYLMVWADLGVLGGVPIYWLLFKSKKIVEKLLGSQSWLFAPLFIQLFLMGLTNPIHASLQIDYVIWFFAPLSFVLFKDKIKNI